MPVQKEGEGEEDLLQERDREHPQPPLCSFCDDHEEEKLSIAGARTGILGSPSWQNLVLGLPSFSAQWVNSDSATAGSSKRAELVVCICKVSPTTGEK